METSILKEAAMYLVHVVCSGKGGIGKSFISALVAQYYLHVLMRPVACFDVDAQTATLSGYGALNAKRIELVRDGTIDAGRLDDLMLAILEANSDVICDVGSSSFIPFVKYAWEADALGILSRQGRQVVFHAVVTGGNGLVETLKGFDILASTVPEEALLYVWKNDYFGPVEAEGKTFEEMAVFQKHRSRVAGVLHLPRKSDQTFGRDLQKMQEQSLTFAEAKASPEFHIFSKQRICDMEREFLAQLKHVV
jgi:hypothetical protein